jgi:hypothetical protein
MVPVGYEEMPIKPDIVYKKDLENKETEPWILVADNSKKHNIFHSIKWDDIN